MKGYMGVLSTILANFLYLKLFPNKKLFKNKRAVIVFGP